ncbi:MAG: hypothetical protein NZ701_10055 [Roseiflexus sp.]|nr:hypothetical protein [Roseiflexus sp.]
MPTSPLYLSTRARLAQHLPQALASQLDTLSLVLVGVVQSMSSQLAKIARAMPLDTTALAKEQRLRRWLENERITQPSHDHPLVQHALHGLRGQRAPVLLDRVLLRNQHTILVVSVGGKASLNPAGLVRSAAARVEPSARATGTPPNRRDAVAARRADERPRRERVALAGAVWLVAGAGV